VARVTIWLAASLGMMPPLFIVAVAGFRGSPVMRLVAVQVATAYTIILLSLLTYLFDQASFIDLPLALAMVSLTGTLLFAQFFERWL
jgi:multisubunit Na+/H+ antiporter MnhF subunit